MTKKHYFCLNLNTVRMPKKSIHLITLGCSKNLVDSENLLSQLRYHGFKVQHNAQNNSSHTVIINTCGFIHDAKTEAIETILAYTEAKKQGKIKRLFVMGCLSQRYRVELQGEIPEVDAFFGINELPDILQALRSSYLPDLITQRQITTPSHYAYLKIAEGCNRRCAFCIIPQIRGAYRSRTIESLLEESRYLITHGVKELILVAQDLSYYGYDLYQEFKLPELLDSLSQLDGLKWIRLHYTYPNNFPKEILTLMRERDNICLYLDMPFQHISDPVLKAMRRGHTSRESKELIRHIRQKVPGIALRTTLMVGFPGETEDDIVQLEDFVQQTHFDRLGVFTYSHEEDTFAHKQYQDHIPEDIKQERATRIMELQQDIAMQLNQKFVGQNLEVVIDEQDADFYYGRSQFDSPEVDNSILIAKQQANLQIGEFYPVKITQADSYDLYGELDQS